MGLWITAAVGAIFLIELAAGRHKNLYGKHDYLVNGACLLLGVSVRPLLAGLVALVVGFALPVGRGAMADVPIWAALPVIVLLAEFANYWAHRLAHRSAGHQHFDWLWRLHRTHHTGKYMNVLLHFRVNLFWALVSGLTWVMALAFYVGQGAAAAVAVILFSAWGIVTHSHFRWDDRIRKHSIVGPVFRALERVIVSPGIHHTHHGYGHDGKNYRNFGVFLSMFDWIFGTLHIPEGRPAKYGIPGPNPHWAEEVFFPLFWKKGCKAKTPLKGADPQSSGHLPPH